MLSTHHATKVVPAAAFRTPAAPSSTGLLPEDAQTRRLEAGETVFFDDDAADEVFEVEVGVVRLCRLLPDGRRAVLGFRFAGETFGIGAGREYGCTAETVTPVTLRGTRRRTLEDAAERSPELRRRLSTALWRELAAAQAGLLALGRMTAAERVAGFLVALSRRAGTPDTVELPMNRLDVADHLGLTIETVSRAMTELRKKGVIALPSPYRVQVLNPAALRALAGETDANLDEADGRRRLAA
jgi:CRP/FNR family transcriptional regulator, anaerobic regulatory protein